MCQKGKVWDSEILIHNSDLEDIQWQEDLADCLLPGNSNWKKRTVSWIIGYLEKRNMTVTSECPGKDICSQNQNPHISEPTSRDVPMTPGVSLVENIFVLHIFKSQLHHQILILDFFLNTTINQFVSDVATDLFTAFFRYAGIGSVFC